MDGIIVTTYCALRVLLDDWKYQEVSPLYAGVVLMSMRPEALSCAWNVAVAYIVLLYAYCRRYASGIDVLAYACLVTHNSLESWGSIVLSAVLMMVFLGFKKKPYPAFGMVASVWQGVVLMRGMYE